MRSVRADDGAVLVVGKVGVLLSVAGRASVSRGGRRLRALGVVGPTEEAGAAGKAASTSTAAGEGPSAAALGLGAGGLTCRVQPGC